MRRFILNEDLGQAIMTYLGQRPYVEVESLIRALNNIDELKEDDPVEDPEEEKEDG